MSLFTYQGNNILNITNTWSTFVAGATNVTNQNNINNCFNMNITTTNNPYNNINVKQNDIGFQINNTDISTYCVASYYDSNSTNYSVPSWATSMRAVLVGGGGGGTTSSVFEQYHINQGHQAGQITYYYYQHNHDMRIGGIGGGGGGFIYISNLPLNGLQTLQTTTARSGNGGQAANGQFAGGQSGGQTNLSIKLNDITYNFLAGGGSGNGNGGGYIIPTIQGLVANGYSGLNSVNGDLKGYQEDNGTVKNTTGNGGIGALSGASNSQYTPISGINYGNGGDGGDSSSITQPGSIGNNGYFRLYFLK